MTNWINIADEIPPIETIILITDGDSYAVCQIVEFPLPGKLWVSLEGGHMEDCIINYSNIKYWAPITLAE